MAITNRQLDQIIQQLPGYDPVATRGDCRFDYQAARNAIEFIEECCTFTQGAKAGEPFTLGNVAKGDRRQPLRMEATRRRPPVSRGVAIRSPRQRQERTGRGDYLRGALPR